MDAYQAMLFQALVLWGHAECSRNDKSFTAENVR